MLDVPVVLLDRWNQHATHGIMELASTPRWRIPFGSVVPDDDIIPPALNFFNDVEHKPLATDAGPAKLPAWLTIGIEQFPVDVEDGKRVLVGRQCVIAMMFVTAPDVNEIKAGQWFGLYARACTLSLARYNHQGKAAGFREHNGIKVHRVGPVIEQHITGAVGRTKCWGMMEVHAIVVDTDS
jgi:hypothetical protein